MEIRDTRNGDWYWVNNIVLSCKSISLADKAVYSALATFSGFQEIRPTFKTIAERCNVGLRTAKESIKMLEVMGFINVENHGKKGVSNVYKLNKSTKGCVKKCVVCTTCITKKCKPVQEEVQNTTKSSAVAAPHIDIHIDKDIDTTEQSSEEWSFEEELKKLKDNSRKDLKIIALYWKKKNYQFANKTQFEKALKRELRAAGNLTGYSGREILTAINYCEEQYNDRVPWTLETCCKRIFDLVNTK